MADFVKRYIPTDKDFQLFRICWKIGLTVYPSWRNGSMYVSATYKGKTIHDDEKVSNDIYFHAMTFMYRTLYKRIYDTGTI